MKKAFWILFFAVAAGALAWTTFKPRYPTPMEFSDAAGEKHSFANYQTARLPVIASFIMQGDTFSPRTIELFHELRAEYPEERLAIVAFYVTGANAAALQVLAQTNGYTFTMVPVAQSSPLAFDLFKTLELKVAGDVVVVSGKGRISTVIAAKDLTQADFEEKVRKGVKGVAGL